MDGKRKEKRTAGDRLLTIYFNDHLAASVGTRELAERCLGHNPEGKLGDFLRRLCSEMEEDREVLKGLLESFGGTEDVAKEAAAWIAEKLGRLKLNGQLVGYSDLSRLEELEALALGIRAKMALWGSLEEMAPDPGRMNGIDLQHLQSRARRQHEETEVYRREAARRVLGSGPIRF